MQNSSPPAYKELRFYCFINFMLSSIQQGIQTGHASVELMTSVALSRKVMLSPSDEMALDWAKNHKTYICLNGGNHAAIGVAEDIIAFQNGRYPHASFYESEEALGGLRTCVGVVLPDYIFNATFDKARTFQYSTGHSIYSYKNPHTDKETVYEPGHPDYELVCLLKNSRLAS